MLKIEKKIIEWINRYMVLIAIVFAFLAAGWIRMTGRNYIGIDYHFCLYDIAGNCNSYIYRTFVDFIMARWTDSAINILKYLAYLGDFGVALLTLFLLRGRQQALSGLHVFLAATVCLLSPVSLIYSVGGMKIDSVCLCFLLIGLLFYQRGLICPALFIMSLSAFLYLAYWPIVVAFGICLTIHEKRQNGLGKVTIAALLILFGLLVFSIFLESRNIEGGYYWGKLFVVDPNRGGSYADFGSWLLSMCRIYGYSFAMLTLLFSFKFRKLRIPALVLQLMVLMLVGWYQTKHFAV